MPELVAHAVAARLLAQLAAENELDCASAVAPAASDDSARSTSEVASE